MSKIEIAPSILNAPFGNLDRIIDELVENGAKYLHFDVMDGHFVNNLSFGPQILKTINLEHKMINDVHLMVEEPLKFVDSFLEAGADYITVHYEVFKSIEDLKKAISYIKFKGLKVGVSIKPSTGVEVLFSILKEIDLILVMSVEPGFGGQAFKPEILKNIKVLQGFREKEGLNYKIEVDGGINSETIKLVKKAGVDIAVVGSFLFKQNSIKAAFNMLEESRWAIL